MVNLVKVEKDYGDLSVPREPELQALPKSPIVLVKNLKPKELMPQENIYFVVVFTIIYICKGIFAD